ncbi:hypothetical protein BGS_1028 [Beggiatoa sp. SS]|nr:hypothetical protein BGS_1028 [Beggiatoa sp. SS]
MGQIFFGCANSEKAEILPYAGAGDGNLPHPIAKGILQKAKTSKVSLPEIDDSQYHYLVTVSVVDD